MAVEHVESDVGLSSNFFSSMPHGHNGNRNGNGLNGVRDLRERFHGQKKRGIFSKKGPSRRYNEAKYRANSCDSGHVLLLVGDDDVAASRLTPLSAEWTAS